MGAFKSGRYHAADPLPGYGMAHRFAPPSKVFCSAQIVINILLGQARIALAKHIQALYCMPSFLL